MNISPAPAERKRQLIAEGGRYRARTVQTRDVVRARFRPGVLAKGALQSLGAGGLAAYLGSGAAAGLVVKVALLLPIATRVGAFFFKGGAAARTIRLSALGAAAAAAYLCVKRKSR